MHILPELFSIIIQFLPAAGILRLNKAIHLFSRQYYVYQAFRRKYPLKIRAIRISSTYASLFKCMQLPPLTYEYMTEYAAKYRYKFISSTPRAITSSFEGEAPDSLAVFSNNTSYVAQKEYALTDMVCKPHCTTEITFSAIQPSDSWRHNFLPDGGRLLLLNINAKNDGPINEYTTCDIMDVMYEDMFESGSSREEHFILEICRYGNIQVWLHKNNKKSWFQRQSARKDPNSDDNMPLVFSNFYGIKIMLKTLVYRYDD